MSADWYREGNIARVIIQFLGEQGWSVENAAYSLIYQQEYKVFARFNAETLIIQIKSFPSTVYTSGAKAGHLKTTMSASQARRWHSGMLLSAVLAQADYPDAIIGIALPCFTSYRQLIQQTQEAFDKLGLVLYVVDSEGVVEMLTKT